MIRAPRRRPRPGTSRRVRARGSRWRAPRDSQLGEGNIRADRRLPARGGNSGGGPDAPDPRRPGRRRIRGRRSAPATPRRQPAGQAREAVSVADHDRCGARQSPAEGGRERRDRDRRRTPEQRQDELDRPRSSSPARSDCACAYPSSRSRGKAVDVGEDRLGEPRRGRLVDPGLLGCRREPPPRRPGRQRGTRPAARRAFVPLQLRAAEAHRGPPAAVVDPLRVANEAHEAPQCFVDPRASRRRTRSRAAARTRAPRRRSRRGSRGSPPAAPARGPRPRWVADVATAPTPYSQN